MQTTGATLLKVKLPSSMWMCAQDRRSAHGLLYLIAVRDGQREREHHQGRIDIGSRRLTSPEVVHWCPLTRFPTLNALDVS